MKLNDFTQKHPFDLMVELGVFVLGFLCMVVIFRDKIVMHFL